MKSRLPAAIAVSLSLFLLLGARGQEAAPQPPADQPKLTEAQVATIEKQLAELERQIQQMRGNHLGGILQKLRAATASDQAAMNLYFECDKLVNMERKEVDKAEARRREEAMQRNLERKGGNTPNAPDEGDFAAAVRLQLQYLVLTLEAHETSDKDLAKMVPKLQAYIQEVVAAAPKIRGQALGYLNGAIGAGGGRGRNPFVEAFQLDRFLDREGWSNRPLDFGDIYAKTILPAAASDSKESLPALYDARINAEAAFREKSMFEQEFALWRQNELPALHWDRATYLFKQGPAPVNAMADMLRLIKEYPGHADSPEWIAELRGLVKAAAPAPVGVNPERPPGS